MAISPGAPIRAVSSTPALDSDERAAWESLNLVLTELSRAIDGHLQQSVGLSYFEYQVLESLERAPRQTLRMSTLGAECDASLSRLSRAATRLEGRALVQRLIDPVDGRYTLCRLTPDGADAVRTAEPDHVEQVRRLVFDTLSRGQVGELRDICTQIGEALRTERRVPAQPLGDTS